MHDRLQYYGVHSEVEIYPGKHHAWFNREPDLTITAERVSAFIAEQFGIGCTVPNKALERKR